MGHRDILWSQNFRREIGFPIISVTTLFIDNASTLPEDYREEDSLMQA